MQLLNRSNNFEAVDGDGEYCIELQHSHFFRSLIWGAFGNICLLRLWGHSLVGKYFEMSSYSSYGCIHVFSRCHYC